MNNQEHPILLVGITVRMLAELAVRAGYPVLALDYFGDADLRALCPGVSLLRDYNKNYNPVSLVDVASSLKASWVVYTASLENHPTEVARLGQGRQLLGNTPETLTRVRNPVILATALQTSGFAFPQTFVSGQEIVVDPTRRWLWKPLRSGGGHSVRPWHGESLPEGGVLQERLAGLIGSAAFVANGRQAVLLGLTEQLVGRRAFGAAGFRYCGNLLPPRLAPDELVRLIQELRAVIGYLTETFELRGLNGLDFIWHEGRVWTIEVNPRPSASLELIDIAYQVRVFEAHVRSFADQLPQFDLEQALASGSAAGKAIIYARQDLVVDDTQDWIARGRRDVPYPGERIRRRHPICTILTTGTTPAICLQELRLQAARLEQELSK